MSANAAPPGSFTPSALKNSSPPSKADPTPPSPSSPAPAKNKSTPHAAPKSPSSTCSATSIPTSPSVAADHHAIGTAAADHFLSRGFQHFAFFGTNREWSDGRLAGFQSHLQKSHHAKLHTHISLPNEEFRQVGNPRITTALKKWLPTLPHPIALLRRRRLHRSPLSAKFARLSASPFPIISPSSALTTIPPSANSAPSPSPVSRKTSCASASKPLACSMES